MESGRNNTISSQLKPWETGSFHFLSLEILSMEVLSFHVKVNYFENAILENLHVDALVSHPH